MPIRNLSEVVALSRELARPERGCSIVGEGNTAARIDANSMWVKASGTTLADAAPEVFVRIDRSRALALLDSGVRTFRETQLGLEDAKVDLESPLRPSRDTLLHAVCLEYDSVEFVARTHPTAIDALVCSREFDDLAALRLTPDHAAVCGRTSLVLPYVTPGVELATELRARLEEFVATHGTPPRIVLLQNNGMLALATSGSQALATTLMAAEFARVLALTAAFGGPRPLTVEQLDALTRARDPFDGPTTQTVPSRA